MPGILWSCVARNGNILVEAGADEGEGEVTGLAQKLMKQKPTPGWEFQRSRRKGLRGLKFHVYDDGDGCDEGRLIWVFACVADKSLEDSQQKSFLEKLVYLTEPLRLDDYLWREGGLLACQGTFGPMLFQRMEQGELKHVSFFLSSS